MTSAQVSATICRMAKSYVLSGLIKKRARTAGEIEAAERRGVAYAELAKRLEGHELKETEASITSKLARGTFAATFFLACLAALEKEGVRLEDL